MPYQRKKQFRKKRPRRGKRTFFRRSRYNNYPPKSLRPKSYFFKRSNVETIVLNPGGTSVPTGWTLVDNGYVTFDLHALNQLHDYSDFTNLFSQYKINGVATKIYMSCTGAESGSALGNAQIQLLRCPFQTGQGLVTDFTEQKFLDMQARKIDTLIKANGRPITFFQKVNQLGETFETGTSSSYAIQKPKFVSTDEANTPHYSSCLRLQLVNGEAINTWTAGGVELVCKIIRTFYIQTRKVE